MRSGDLRKRVILQKRDVTLDSAGQQVTTWTTLATVWASIEALSVRDLLAAQAVQSEVSHKITVRYRSEFSTPVADATYRLNYNGRLFNIKGVMNIDERNRTIEIMAGEGLNNG